MIKVKDGSSWVLYDYVSNIRHLPVADQKELDYCQHITDKDYTKGVTFSKKDKTVFITLSSKTLDSSIKILAFSPVFILNDHGQTVDRI